MKYYMLIIYYIHSVYSKPRFIFDTKEKGKNTYLLTNNINNNNIQLYNNKRYVKDELLENIGNSIKDYYKLFKELKSSGIYDQIDWVSYNEDILYELCMEGTIDGELGEDICSPYMKKYQIEILKDKDENIDLDKIIYNNNKNNNKFKLSK